MNISELKTKITSRTANLAVIGLGYVGLPVAAMFAEQGFDVVGVEIIPERVEKINAGQSPIDGEEPGLAELVSKTVQSGKLRATGSYEELRDRDVILIDVETPVEANHKPRYGALRSALDSLCPVLKRGALVIIESTIAPGTMQHTVLPLLEAGTGQALNQGFTLGCCPERVMPGKLLKNLRSLSRVVGGGSPETAEAMLSLYRYIVEADLDPTDWITAELVKTTENAYRDVQIAFANEVALICQASGGDVWKVRELVNKSPFRQMHMPGAGVGGHCIPKDPWLLAHGAEGSGLALRLIPAAREINDGMPLAVLGLIENALKKHNLALQGTRILMMGYAYLENSDDTRNSPSETLANALREAGAEVVVHDPFVPGCQGDLYEFARGCCAAVVMVAHSEYRQTDLVRLQAALQFPVLVDGRRVFDGQTLIDQGWTFRGIGIG